MEDSVSLGNIEKINKLFDSKVIELKEEREKQYHEVNLIYANAFVELVVKALAQARNLNECEYLKIKNDIIGNYSDQSLVMLSESGMDIYLKFKNSIYREKVYDENYINDMLKNSNISIKTEERLITISFNRQIENKKQENSH